MMKQRKLRVLILSLCALLIFSGAMADVWAKYVKNTTLSGDITFTAELGNIYIREKQAQKQPEGHYILTETVLGRDTYNSYETVMPGVDIPKDAWVEVTDKSPIPAYIYLTVDVGPVNGTNEIHLGDTGISYVLADHWKLVEGSESKYCYVDGSGNPVPVTTNIPNIPILKTNWLIVSQYLKLPDMITLNWQAELVQVPAP